ncbi:MAG: hypothetical protein WAZ18_04560 [Alphaproteobacteria bacterium]
MPKDEQSGFQKALRINGIRLAEGSTCCIHPDQDVCGFTSIDTSLLPSKPSIDEVFGVENVCLELASPEDSERMKNSIDFYWNRNKKTSRTEM